MNTISRDRRQLLKRLISTGASIPFLSYLPSLGASAVGQKKLLLCYSPNGTIGNEYFPSGNGQNFTFKRILKPLDPYKNDISVYKGINITAPKPGCKHARGSAIWTGALLAKSGQSGGNNQVFGYPQGPSVDQVLARQIGGDTAFRTLPFAYKAGRATRTQNRMLYSAANTPVSPMENPYNAFKTIYNNFKPSNDAPSGGGGGNVLSEQDKRNIRVSSVLDGVLPDFSRVQRYLSVEDKQKVERHAEAVRDLEKRLDVAEGENPTTPTGPSCSVPDLKPGNNPSQDAQRAETNRLFADLMITSLACNRTRICSMQLGSSANGGSFPHLGINGNHHQISHTNNSETLIKIDNYYATWFAYMVKGLKETPDPSGEGSLLDNSFMIWGNELGNGKGHTLTDIPLTAAGTLQGHFKPGYYQLGGVTHNKLLTSILQGFGVNANGFGREPNSGALDAVTV